MASYRGSKGHQTEDLWEPAQPVGYMLSSIQQVCMLSRHCDVHPNGETPLTDVD